MAHDILIVDDEADIRSLVVGILEDEGYSCREAGTDQAALAAIAARRPSLVLQDIWLQGSKLDGLGILALIKQDHPDVPVVMMSGHGTIETAVAAIKEGAYDFIEKPFQTDRMLLVVERAIEQARLKRELFDLKNRSGGAMELVGNTSAMNQLRQSVEKVAPTGSRVLISGPPGSGKEVVARLLHAKSKRAEGPFVVLNCAALNPERMEIELFGTEQGMSEGSGRKIGLLEQAHTGTLMLDEVADMPLETQGKIVRVLQDQTFERVGGGTRVEVDVRVIASSNRELQEQIAAGRFREDLFYRLNVVPVKVPSLKDCREDIPQIAQHFMDRAARTAGVIARQLGEDAQVVLKTYDWPGNARQLRNVMEWLLIMSPGDAREPISAPMLPPDLSSATPAVLKWDKSSELMSLPLREARELFEREYLATQVARFNGNISRTSAFVGMERSALHRKLKSLGIGSSED
ncbi:MAG: sigma-54-dependent Fis family transcriptional regulator [Alphaproteobacteria bacterium]|nr:sigma-54-dependent Fis family transcriptional regulator [Alphaproteobacteria bacterium]